MRQIATVAKAAMLVAFLFVNPKIIGSIYIGMFLIRSAAKCVQDVTSRFICMLIVSITVAALLPFCIDVSMPMAIAFAALLTWVFAWHNNPPVFRPDIAQSGPETQENQDDVIDVEVISIRTITKEED